MPRARGCVGILFFLSMIAGIILGILVINPKPLPPPPPPETLPPTNSILILGVDSLENSDPGLEGAWIVTMPLSNQRSNQELHFEIFSMYPVSAAKVLTPELSQFTKPHQKITIDPENLFSETPLVPLGLDPDDWFGTIVIDEYIINMLILLQNPNNTIEPPDDDLFIKPWLDPQGALDQQKGILTTLCEHPQPLAYPSVIALILEMESSHIRSNLGEGGLLTLWQHVNYSYDRPVSCDIFQ